MHVPWARCCVYALVWMCAGAIEAVLWRGSLQENCHKQSAPASVKRQAWENWLLYMLGATPRSLNKPAHLPNAVTSKWAMCCLCATPGWQRSRDTGQCHRAAAENRCHATPWKWAERGYVPAGMTAFSGHYQKHAVTTSHQDIISLITSYWTASITGNPSLICLLAVWVP